ncbi:GNAT family N-acetyltransferase [Brumimicrobium oceani]|uniref:GNAT family N-acetyltransferase n=2 Tax=Brumimicrobium oceani TaxID=2100725 RepID=A0A2U2XAF2_9FLAO|nr:GNAT family N-acetyltransferase [Brumimicrobium oceani]
MQDIKLRLATIEDLDALEEFEQAVIQYERPFAPQLKDGPIHYYAIEDLIKNENSCFVVAEYNNQLVASGYASMEEAEPTKKERFHAYLGFMYVVPEFRGKGINGMIVQHLIDWSKKHDLSEIVIELYAENQSALQAYKKIGFHPDLLKMRLNTEEE